MVSHHVAGAHCPAVGVGGDCDPSIGRGKRTRHRVVLSRPVLSTRWMRHCAKEKVHRVLEMDAVYIAQRAACAAPLECKCVIPAKYQQHYYQ